MASSTSERDALVLLVDGGGTGTRVRLLRHGHTIGTGSSGPANLCYGIAAAWNHIEEAAKAAAGEATLDAAALRGLSLWGGFAGAGALGVVDAFRAADPIGCRRIAVMTDGLAALIGAHSGGPGAVLALGTGVAAQALRPAGDVVVASGWGLTVGDEGGGAWIGRAGVSMLTRALDGRIARRGPMLDALADAVGADYGAIQMWLVSVSATRFAHLAPLIVAAADAGDPLADRILRDAAAEVELALHAVAPDGPVALLGGLASTIAPRLSSDVQTRLVPADGNGLDGLALLAGHGWSGEDFKRNGGFRDTWSKRIA